MMQNKLIKGLGICFVLVLLMSPLVSAGFLDWFVGLFGNSATGYISAAPSPNQCLNHEDIKSKIESVNAKLDILIGDGEEAPQQSITCTNDEAGDESCDDGKACRRPYNRNAMPINSQPFGCLNKVSEGSFCERDTQCAGGSLQCNTIYNGKFKNKCVRWDGLQGAGCTANNQCKNGFACSKINSEVLGTCQSVEVEPPSSPSLPAGPRTCASDSDCTPNSEKCQARIEGGSKTCLKNLLNSCQNKNECIVGAVCEKKMGGSKLCYGSVVNTCLVGSPNDPSCWSGKCGVNNKCSVSLSDVPVPDGGDEGLIFTNAGFGGTKFWETAVIVGSSLNTQMGCNDDNPNNRCRTLLREDPNVFSNPIVLYLFKGNYLVDKFKMSFVNNLGRGADSGWRYNSVGNRFCAVVPTVRANDLNKMITFNCVGWDRGSYAERNVVFHNGQDCSNDNRGANDFCFKDLLVGGVEGASCQPGQGCLPGLECVDGTCRGIYDPTMGKSCNINGECKSNNCVLSISNKKYCTARGCLDKQDPVAWCQEQQPGQPIDMWCQMDLSNNRRDSMCKFKLDDSQSCSVSMDCKSNNCGADGICRPRLMN